MHSNNTAFSGWKGRRSLIVRREPSYWLLLRASQFSHARILPHDLSELMSPGGVG